MSAAGNVSAAKKRKSRGQVTRKSYLPRPPRKGKLPMAQRKLKQVADAVNAAPVNKLALAAAVWEAVGKIAGKESRRDDIPDGSAHKIELYLAAKIDGQIYRQGFTANLTVGHGSTRAASSLPNMGEVLGHVLAQLNGATREAVLAKLPEIYAANDGKLPEVPAEIAAAADGMLEKLRASKTQTVRGPVSVKYDPAAAPLSLVG